MGYNLLQSQDGCTLSGASPANLIGMKPQVGSLADNGETTLTHALLSGSPATDAGSPSGSAAEPCVATDQRGIPRPACGGCDMGCYECANPLCRRYLPWLPLHTLL